MAYDAFISYSHSADGRLAPALQSALQRLARPWYRRRALRIFRDETGLSVNPHLWGSIEKALDDSRYFVLLASPAAAESPWVNREVEHWLKSKSPDTLLPVLTDGTLVWDSGSGGFDIAATTALPAAALGAFTEEPRFLDLRWARDETQLDLRHSMFRSQIAALAAPMHGVAKEDLEGEDVRLHRRALRMAWAAGIALALLTLAAVATSALAVNSAGAARRSARRAVEQRQRADDEAALASAARVDADHQKQVAVDNAAQAEASASEAQQEQQAADASALVADDQKHLADLNAQQAQANAQQAQTNEQQAQANEQQAQANAALAEAAQHEVAAKNGQLQRANGQLSALNGELRSTNTQLAQANKNLSTQEDITSRERVAGIARQLILGSEASLATGVTDRALLLAAEATKFAARSGGLVSDADLRPALVAALQTNPRVVGWLQGLAGPIAEVAVAPDNSRAAALSLNGHVGVWDLRTQRLLSTFPVSDAATWVRFVDARSLIVAGNTRVDAYRASDDAATWTHAWGWKAPTSLGAISTAGGRVLVGYNDVTSAAGYTNHYRLFSVTGDRLGSLDVVEQVTPDHVVLAPSGSSFAVAGRAGELVDSGGVQTIHYYVDVDVFTGPKFARRSLRVDPSKIGAVVDVGFSPDGHRIGVLADDSDRSVYEWDAANGHKLVIEPGGGRAWSAVVPDTPIGLSPDFDAVVQRDPDNVSLAGIGHVGTGTFTGDLIAPVAGTNVFSRTVDPFQAPAFTSDGARFIVGGGESAIPIFELPDSPFSHFAQTRSLPSLDANGAVAVSPDGRVLASITNNETVSPSRSTLRLTTLDGSRGRVDIPLPSEPSGVDASSNHPLAFDAGGDELAVVFNDGSVDVYDTANGARRFQLAPQAHCNPFSTACGFSFDLAFSGSAQRGRIAEENNGQVWTWELDSGRVVAMHAVQVAPSGDGTVLVRLDATGSRFVVVTDTFVPFLQLTVHVFDATADGWTEHQSFPAPVGNDLALSPDGSRAVEVDGGAVTMYDLDHGGVVWRAVGDDTRVWYAPDGTLLTASPSGSVRVRSTDTGSVNEELTPTSASGTAPVPSALVFTGSHVVAAVVAARAPFGVTVTDWVVAPDALATAACNEAHRSLSVGEWNQFVGTFDAYEKSCPDFP